MLVFTLLCVESTQKSLDRVRGPLIFSGSGRHRDTYYQENFFFLRVKIGRSQVQGWSLSSLLVKNVGFEKQQVRGRQDFGAADMCENSCFFPQKNGWKERLFYNEGSQRSCSLNAAADFNKVFFLNHISFFLLATPFDLPLIMSSCCQDWKKHWKSSPGSNASIKNAKKNTL